MSSIRELRSITQTGTEKPDAATSFPGGTTSIRKLRAQKLPTHTTVRQTAPTTAPQQRLLDVPEQKENSSPDTQAEDWTKAGQRFLQNSPMKNGATPLERKNTDLRPYSFYTEKIDTAIADGDWTSAGKWTDALCNANLSAEDAEEVVTYIDKTFSQENLYNNGGKANKGLSAARYILDLADRSQWETLYDFMNSPESKEDKELLMEMYGIDADSEESKRDNYYGLVEQLQQKIDRYGYDTLSESAESYKTQIATNRFLRRTEENFKRASQSPAHAAQMDSYIRSQTAYYILDVLSGMLGVEDNGVNTEDILKADTTVYLFSYLQKECGVDLSGIDAANYRQIIRSAMEEQSKKARLMGNILQSEGYDTEAVREYAKLGVQQGYENTRSKAFEEWKADASWYDWVGMNALTVPFKAAIQPFTSVATLSALGGKNSDVNNPNSYIPMYGSQDGIDMIRSATVEEIEKSTNWRLFGRNVASFLYTTGMSAIDSAASAYSFGKLSVFLMGTTAAGSQANNILARGGNRRQALYGGLAAGAIEVVTEYFSVDKLLKNAGTATNLKEWFKVVGQQCFTEGSEEMASEVLDILVDAANMGNLSENSQAVKEYMQQGLSYDEARTRVLYDNIGRVVEAGISGSISGGITSAITNTASVTRSSRSISNAAKSFTYGLMQNTESPAYQKYAAEAGVLETDSQKTAEKKLRQWAKQELMKSKAQAENAMTSGEKNIPQDAVDDAAETSQNKPEGTAALSGSNMHNAASNESRSDREQPTVHSLLMETDASKVKNTIERKYLKEYQQTAARQLAEQQKLDKLQTELDALPKEKRQTSRARFLRDEIIKTKNRLQICQSIQTRLETDSPLTYLIHREIKPRLAEVQKIDMPQTKAKTTALPYGQNSEADLAMGNDKEPQQVKQHASLAQTGFKRQYGREQISIANQPNRGIINAQDKINTRITEESFLRLIDCIPTNRAEDERNRLQDAATALLTEARKIDGGRVEFGSVYSSGFKEMLWSGRGEKHSVGVPTFDVPHIVLHTHPNCRTFSETDINHFLMNESVEEIIAIGNDGSFFSLRKTEQFIASDFVLAFAELFRPDSYVYESRDIYAKAMSDFLKEATQYGVEYFERSAKSS